jgi:hypothetical protein
MAPKKPKTRTALRNLKDLPSLDWKDLAYIQGGLQPAEGGKFSQTNASTFGGAADDCDAPCG